VCLLRPLCRGPNRGTRSLPVTGKALSQAPNSKGRTVSRTHTASVRAYRERWRASGGPPRVKGDGHPFVRPLGRRASSAASSCGGTVVPFSDVEARWHTDGCGTLGTSSLRTPPCPGAYIPPRAPSAAAGPRGLRCPRPTFPRTYEFSWKNTGASCPDMLSLFFTDPIDPIVQVLTRSVWFRTYDTAPETRCNLSDRTLNGLI